MAFFSFLSNCTTLSLYFQNSLRSRSICSLNYQYPETFISFRIPLLPKKYSGTMAQTSQFLQSMPQAPIEERGLRIVVWFCRKTRSLGMWGQFFWMRLQRLRMGRVSLGPSTVSILPSGMQILSDHPPPRSRSTRCRIDSGWMLQSCRVRSFSSCLPAKIRRCWSGGMPSLSWMRLFSSSMVMRMDVSISTVLPVSVLTYITPLADCMLERPSSAFFILRRQPSSMAALAFSLMMQMKPVTGLSTCFSMLMRMAASFPSFVFSCSSPSISSLAAYL